MLFNSIAFIFAFLPVTIAGFFALGRFSRGAALLWLVVMSTLFYGWWRPLNILIIAPSMVVNYALARALQRLGEREDARKARLVLIAGIAFNIAFLAYFKYKNFFIGTVNDVIGTDIGLAQLILPLGISFITFQKIAFLVDVHAKRITAFTAFEYCLFVMFFPQLIAGPIVHYREVMPQFRAVSARLNTTDLLVGLTLFSFGLYKKVVLADGIAGPVESIYAHAATGESISLIPAWMAAVGYTLQIYFDFSGYTDMALGGARIFGIRLPANFNSPLKATSIIDFWQRWHITLTRFLTGYVYNPLVLSLTRRRLKRGLPIITRKTATLGAFLSLAVFPTMLTMFVSGFWHGAGYAFIIWGLLHGLYLSINHAWRLLRAKYMEGVSVPSWVSKTASLLLTLSAVALAMVFFHGPSVGSAIDIVGGMFGVNGAPLTETWLQGRELAILSIWIPSLLFFALACPNTLQIMRAFEPAASVTIDGGAESGPGRIIAWQKSFGWVALAAAIGAIAVLHIGRESAFIYWQF